MQNNYLTKVLGIQGFIAQKITIDQEEYRSCVILDLRREEKEFVCSGCHQKQSRHFLVEVGTASRFDSSTF